ncbi:MAG: TRAP transporter large permease, partial [Halanaerobiales bacterium]
TGSIAAGGTLGILIPPSIMLVLMAQQAEISVGKLFAAAIIPGFLLAFLYIMYILILCNFKPHLAPLVSKHELSEVSTRKLYLTCAKSLIPPALLVLAVLGSIFLGFATPTEASALGAFVSLLLIIIYRKFSWLKLYEACIQTAKTNAMVIFILCGASCFTVVFTSIGGEEIVTKLLVHSGLGKWPVFILMMFIVFLLGMFIDWLGIVLICLPIFLPIAEQLGFNKVWFVTIIAVNLQASFLTPPFGYALFYLSGITPSDINIIHIYKGIIPFVCLMLFGLFLCVIFPNIILWLPNLIVS